MNVHIEILLEMMVISWAGFVLLHIVFIPGVLYQIGGFLYVVAPAATIFGALNLQRTRAETLLW